MMNSKIYMTLGLLIASIGHLSADESKELSSSQEETIAPRVEVGARVCLKENQTDLNVTDEKDEDALLAKGMFYSSHDGAYHYAQSISYLGDSVTIEDGSIWTIASCDWWKTEQWLASDTLLIMQNKFFYSNYQFLIVNQNSGQEVEANLSVGPFINGGYTHWITSIDYANRYVFLEDGTVWDIADRKELNSWRINDTMIIGINRQANYDLPNILINVNTLNYCRGINLSN